MRSARRLREPAPGQRSAFLRRQRQPRPDRRIERMIASEGIAVPVVRRECPGRCERRPVMRIAPGGPFFTEIDDAQLAVIIDGPKSFIDLRNGSEN